MIVRYVSTQSSGSIGSHQTRTVFPSKTPLKCYLGLHTVVVYFVRTSISCRVISTETHSSWLRRCICWRTGDGSKSGTYLGKSTSFIVPLGVHEDGKKTVIVRGGKLTTKSLVIPIVLNTTVELLLECDLSRINNQVVCCKWRFPRNLLRDPPRSNATHDAH